MEFLVLVQRHRKLFTSIIRLSAVATAMLMVTILVVTHSEAAFSATTVNTANSFSTGSVVLTDDDLGSAMFSAAPVSPGAPAVSCIVVTYEGTLVPADVRLYGSSAGALAPYLDTTIEVGTGGDSTSCAGFVPSGPAIFVDTLDNLPTGWAGGVPVFTALSNPEGRTLRFSVDVQNVPAAQSESATADFTFEAQD